MQVLLQRMTKVMTTGTDLFDYDEKPPPRSLNSVARKQRLMHISKRNKVRRRETRMGPCLVVCPR